jgi:uracil-DNA glycosylase family 4
MDHDEQGFNHNAEILFVSESFKLEFGELTPFSAKEENLFESALKELINVTEYTASVKCPTVKDKDISKDDKDICRKHIATTIAKCKNLKLIFACGNLPLVMLTKKSGIMDKRGKTYMYNNIPVVPIYHPYQVIVEPQNKYLFDLDIQNAIETHYFKKQSVSKFEWELVYTLDKLHALKNYVGIDVAVDIETTGLDFLKDEIQTIALSFDGEQQRTFCIPLYHKEFNAPFGWAAEVASVLNLLLSHDFSKKIFHKAQFDTKFLAREGVKLIRNIYDTKLIQHMIDENVPKSLNDLCQYYFPEELGII